MNRLAEIPGLAPQPELGANAEVDATAPRQLAALAGAPALPQLEEEWVQLPSDAGGIAVAAGGPGTWVLSSIPGLGGFELYELVGETWEPAAHRGIRLAVSSDGTPAVVDIVGRVTVREGNDWRDLPGVGVDVAFDPGGRLWMLGTAPGSERTQLLSWHDPIWHVEDGTGHRLTFHGRGHPVLVGATGNALRHDGTIWQQLPGLHTDVEANGLPALYAVGIDGVAYRLDLGGPRAIASGVAEVAVGNGRLWVLRRDRSLWWRNEAYGSVDSNGSTVL
jgi:hypothetical protein